MNADEFKELTESGKFRAVTTQEIRADKAERNLEQVAAKLEQVARLALGIVRLVCVPDDVMDAALRWAEKDAKQTNK